MVILPKQKAVLLKLQDPSQVANAIPAAKLFRVKGVTYAAVPHRVLETRVLRNLGINVPAPIRHQYEWPGRFKPFDAQRTAAAFLTMNDRAFNLSELGTGKSLAALWAFDFLKSQGLVHSALIISPLSTLERTWADEVFFNFPHLETVVLYGSRAKRLKLLDVPADIYVVNHDGVKIIEPALKARKDIDIVIIDEIAQAARNASTNRWKSFNRVVNGHGVRRACWGLTGTPTPNEPTDAWAQCRLVVPKSVSPYYTHFREQVMKKFSQFVWLPRADATEKVREVMQPAIRFTRDECLDLPDIMFETRAVPAEKTQQEAYTSMMRQLFVEAEEGKVTAVNEAVKLSKLLQIACGVVYGPNGEELTFRPKHRINETKDIIRSAEGKVIVFAPFVSAVEYLAEELRQDFTVEVIHGGVAKAERDRIFQAFQVSSDPKVVVAQPAAMSHGLTLTAASTIVWFAPITSNEIFEQANGRINRPGQKMNNFVIMLQTFPVERKVYTRLEGKQKMQGALLAEIKAGRKNLLS